MAHSFRHHHILMIMEGYDHQSLPLDRFVGNYFRQHKSLGSKDRSEIAETVYAMIRFRGLLDEICKICGFPSTWEQKLKAFCDESFSSYKESSCIPPHIRVSFPKILFDHLSDCFGEGKAIDICKVSNSAAPTTARVNTMKTSRDSLILRLAHEFHVTPCTFAPDGIVFSKRISFSQMPEFREGLFEIQDEGSQLIGGLVEAKPGQLVMDYCAGAGGKTLCFAPRMQNRGQIYLHDIRKWALDDCKKRLRRAGIQNAQIVLPDQVDKLKKLKKQFDWVLVDAPCTGTGTLRRNPDMKWKINEEMLVRLVGQQRMIFEKALSFMKPDGHIVYATCSLLKMENRDQVDHFIKTYDLELVRDFESIPILNGMDGFFGAVLRRKSGIKTPPHAIHLI